MLEEIAGGAIRVVALFLAILFVLAAVHKVRVVALGGAHELPLMRLDEWRTRHAQALLALAAVAEIAVAVLLLVAPPEGLGAALALLLRYSWDLRRLKPQQSCGCFGNFLKANSISALRRNVMLAAASGAAFVPAITGWTEPASISQATAGGALAIVAAFAAADAVIRVTQPAGTAGDFRRAGGGLAS